MSNQISFAKVIKVEGSSNAAGRVCDIANGHYSSGSPDYDRKIKTLLNDVKNGHAQTYENNQTGDIFILSGKASREYDERFYNMLEALSQSQNSPYGDNSDSLLYYFEEHIKNKIANSNQKAISVEYNERTRKVTSFEVIA